MSFITFFGVVMAGVPFVRLMNGFY
jgi:hypothetical protein